MDFIFGTLSTDELKLYRHRAAHRGVQHGHRVSPRRPQPHEACRLTVTTGVDCTAQSVVAYVTTEGSMPQGTRGAAEAGCTVIPFEPGETVWDTLAWGYLQRWHATLPGYPAETLVRYRIGAWGDQSEEIFADAPDVTVSSEHAATRYFAEGRGPEMDTYYSSNPYGPKVPGTIFTLPIGLPAAPAWAHDASIYHIFVDRFYPGDDRGWQPVQSLLDVHGGTLRGILDKVDYIAQLGVNCIWLSPIWASPTHHGYDTTDYRMVEPRLGSADDLRRLVDALHDRGIRVLLDMACNHLSVAHPLFQTALHDSRSTYRDWFYFDDSAIGYQTFFGVAELPKINLHHADARDWMIDNALYWLRDYQIDGYRLDYANGPGPDFWSYFNRACKAESPASFCFGEVIDAPDMMAAYIGRLDGALDFQMNDALRRTFGWQRWTEETFHTFVQRHTQHFPKEFVMPAFIDNHDMDRFLHIAGSTNPDRQQDAFLRALTTLFALPNPPILYYGTEIGLTQPRHGESGMHVNRVPMRWGAAQNKALLAQVKALIHSRPKSG